jgi:hypothetical protein
LSAVESDRGDCDSEPMMSTNNNEAALVELMRADRVVQKRRQDAQLLKDLEATEETASAAPHERLYRGRP